jgi:hypothetical protein
MEQEHLHHQSTAQGRPRRARRASPSGPRDRNRGPRDARGAAVRHSGSGRPVARRRLGVRRAARGGRRGRRRAARRGGRAVRGGMLARAEGDGSVVPAPARSLRPVPGPGRAAARAGDLRRGRRRGRGPGLMEEGLRWPGLAGVVGEVAKLSHDRLAAPAAGGREERPDGHRHPTMAPGRRRGRPGPADRGPDPVAGLGPALLAAACPRRGPSPLVSRTSPLPRRRRLRHRAGSL